jgi:membrane fusion protein (multidrug efflux system)
MRLCNSVPAAGMLASVLSAASILLNGCNKPAAPPPRGPAAVEVIPAVERDVPLTGEWVATTDGYVNAQIQPQVSGYLIRQDYKEGSEVHKDQVLFEIDPRPLQATLDQAKGALAQAQAQLGLAEINTKRDTPLAKPTRQ